MGKARVGGVFGAAIHGRSCAYHDGVAKFLIRGLVCTFLGPSEGCVCV